MNQAAACRRVRSIAGGACLAAACATGTPEAPPASSAPRDETVANQAGSSSASPVRAGSATLITDESQLDAAIGREVTIVGVQTRTKIPTVCGVDVDGDYDLSDKEVEVRGVLRRQVVREVDPMSASRGPGTYHSVVDPATGRLARTTPRR